MPLAFGVRLKLSLILLGTLLPTLVACPVYAGAQAPEATVVPVYEGFTAGAGKIWLTILPGGDWKDWITHGIAHEYHHCVWTERYHNKNPILNVADYLVFEGRADSFANIIDPLRHSPWTNALTRQQERTAWRTIERRLQSTDAQLMQGLMFGGAEGVPHWAGYTIGFQIVQSFLKAHPDLNVSQWTAIPANELVQQASYAPAP